MAGSNPSDGAEDIRADYEALKQDMKALKADFTNLVKDTGRVASVEARRQAEKAKKLAGDSVESLEELRDVVEKKVREHPLAAIGIAAGVAFVLAAAFRRR